MKSQKILMIALVVALAGMVVGGSLLDPLPNGDQIPDFSTVGYHHGDDAIPTLPVTVTITPPADGTDATATIQKAWSPSTEVAISAAAWCRRAGLALRAPASRATQVRTELVKRAEN